MIKKLKIKFILINMSMVFVVLLVVFLSIFFSTKTKLENQSIKELEIAVTMKFPDKGFEIGNPQDKNALTRNIVCVTVGADGSILKKTGGAYIDDGVLSESVTAVSADGAESGEIAKYDLRYVKTETPDGTKIAFSSTSGEKNSLKTLFLNSLIIGLCALSAFLVISVFLSQIALSPLERAWKQQKQFIADASHELKTPLTVILANTSILLSRENDGEKKKWLENTGAESEHMKGLVEEMLFLAKTEDAEKPELRFGRINLSDVTQGCVLQFEPVAFEKNVVIGTDIEKGIEIRGNMSHIKRLVDILLDNACKYAGDGGRADVSLSRTRDGILLSVKNTGEPIPEEDIPHIFERFYRADKARADGGYGLGLTIAKSIASEHKASVSVSSTEASGTEFRVRF